MSNVHRLGILSLLAAGMWLVWYPSAIGIQDEAAYLAHARIVARGDLTGDTPGDVTVSMIETPRAALTAGEIAKESDFFSFGTNDLTQMTFGFSRDDAEGKFLRSYIDQGILPNDPFASIDPHGVGALVKMGVDAGRRQNPNLEIGICGEHGGDPASVVFCHEAGLDYVSCSPFRVPVARLAAAQAALAAS